MSAEAINDADCLVVIYRNEVFSLDPAAPLREHAGRRERLNVLLGRIDGDVVRREAARRRAAGAARPPGCVGMNESW